MLSATTRTTRAVVPHPFRNYIPRALSLLSLPIKRMRSLEVKLLIACWISAFIITPTLAQSGSPTPEQQLQAYRASLDQLRQEHTTPYPMPAIRFFLFGMGDRKKMIYKDGILKEANTGTVLEQWKVKKEVIVPSEYLVYLETEEGKKVRIQENEKGVYLSEGGKQAPLAESKLQLPDFKGHPYAPILRTLHHEVLINVDQGLPVPNFLVYKKPWYRDASLMGMVMKKTGNLHLIRDWIMQIRDPFDRNNRGISEADNPGQVLFLISLVSDKNHPAVKITLDSVKQFHKENYIEGKSDFALHPVYQTKWIKYGLQSLGLQNLDHYVIPKVYDNYSGLFWWDYKKEHVAGQRFNQKNSVRYPYLVWAEDHFYGEKNGVVTDQDYPLSWEAYASQAKYPAMEAIDPELARQKISPPHTWHAAEMFLLLIDSK